MRGLLKSKLAVTAAAVLAVCVTGVLYKFFGVLAFAIAGSIAAILNAHLDDKLAKTRYFFSVCAILITLGSTWLSYLAMREANSRSRQFEDSLKSTTEKLLQRTDEVARLAAENAGLAKALAVRSDEIAQVNRSVAFPLNRNLVAHIAIEISGDRPPVALLAAQLHARAFPDGKQRFGFWMLNALDSRIKEQETLAYFVGSLGLSFAFCANQSCDFAPEPSKRSRGVESTASAGLGPDVQNSTVQPDPLVQVVQLGRQVRVQYDVRFNRFWIILDSEPLEFFQLASSFPNSNDLANKFTFFQIGFDHDLRPKVVEFLLKRSDGRVIQIQKIQSTEARGVPWFFGRLGSWR